MAYLDCNIYSDTLVMETGVSVVLPHDSRQGLSDEPARVLYLLHGIKQSHRAWVMYTDIVALAQAARVAVVMPEVHRSFYADMAYGLRYYTYVAGELPRIMKAMFNISDAREDTFIAGFSMGGYGALKLALRNPERYSRCAAYAAATDIRAIRATITPDDPAYAEAVGIFGPELTIKPDDDLFALAEAVSKLPAEKQPQIYHACGTGDRLYAMNAAFRDYAKKLPLNYTYEEWPDEHTTGFSGRALAKTFELWFK